jgi:hypothetical protein
MKRFPILSIVALGMILTMTEEAPRLSELIPGKPVDVPVQAGLRDDKPAILTSPVTHSDFLDATT